MVDRAALTAVVAAVAAARAEQTGSQPGAAEQAGGGPGHRVGGRPGRVRGGPRGRPGGPGARARPARSGSRTAGPTRWPAGCWRCSPWSQPLCAGYATIVVVLAAAASAPGRARSLATARVLGLRHRDTTRVAAGELLPSILVAAVGGVLLGVVLVGALVAPLALRLVTGQAADPGVVLPWWAVVPVVLLGGDRAGGGRGRVLRPPPRAAGPGAAGALSSIGGGGLPRSPSLCAPRRASEDAAWQRLRQSSAFWLVSSHLGCGPALEWNHRRVPPAQSYDDSEARESALVTALVRGIRIPCGARSSNLETGHGRGDVRGRSDTRCLPVPTVEGGERLWRACLGPEPMLHAVAVADRVTCLG